MQAALIETSPIIACPSCVGSARTATPPGAGGLLSTGAFLSGTALDERQRRFARHFECGHGCRDVMTRQMLSSIGNAPGELRHDPPARGCCDPLNFVVDRAKDRAKITVRVRRFLACGFLRLRRTPGVRRQQTLGLKISPTREIGVGRSDRAGRT